MQSWVLKGKVDVGTKILYPCLLADDEDVKNT